MGAARARGAASRTAARTFVQRASQMLRTTTAPRAQTASRISAGSMKRAACAAAAGAATAGAAGGADKGVKGWTACSTMTAPALACPGGRIAGAMSRPSMPSAENGTRNLAEAANHRP